MNSGNEVLLQLKNVCKSFSGVQALDNVSFELRTGEVHCLLGENGAGKSTLIKILSGAYKKDSGSIILRGQEVNIENAHDSKELGIYTIYQELNLIPSMTITENIFLGDEIYRKGTFITDWPEMERKAKEILKELNIELNVKTLVRELSTAQQQMVEIAKSLMYKKDIIIMDEPTSSISEKDTKELFRIIKKLKAQGVSIIYISHRLQELSEIVDRVSVLRDGKYIKTVNMNEVCINDLITMMVGRVIDNNETPEKRDSNEVVLEAINISKGREVKNVSFKLKKGEILGFAGLVGSGRSETMKIIFGADTPDSGEIKVKGKILKNNNTVKAVRSGISYLSEDRKMEGLVLGMSISHNMTLANLSCICKGFILNLQEEKTKTQKMAERLKVVSASLEKQVKYLSGGNQQKVVVGKWLMSDCDILIFDEPTRGIDVGARAEIYQLMNQLANNGKSIIMVSSDLPEILKMSNRIIVMSNGMITGEIDNTEINSQEDVMKLMLGGLHSA